MHRKLRPALLKGIRSNGWEGARGVSVAYLAIIKCLTHRVIDRSITIQQYCLSALKGMYYKTAF